MTTDDPDKGWWTVIPPARAEEELQVTRAWASALGLEVRVQVRRVTT